MSHLNSYWPDLPSSDPLITGALWHDFGTVKRSVGEEAEGGGSFYILELDDVEYFYGSAGERFDPGTNDFAFETWVLNTGAIGYYDFIFQTREEGHGSNGFTVGSYWSATQTGVWIWLNDSVESNRMIEAVIYQDPNFEWGTWQHIAINFDRSASASGWINGENANQTPSISAHNASLGSDKNNTIGADDANDRQFEGEIAYIRIYDDYLLTQGDVDWLYDNGIQSHADLIASDNTDMKNALARSFEFNVDVEVVDQTENTSSWTKSGSPTTYLSGEI